MTVIMGGATESESTTIARNPSLTILTNNPLVAEAFSETFLIELLPSYSDREILMLARDRVHLGHKILTAPLSGSVKPWETPYRSVLMTTEPADGVDHFSLRNMESALAAIQHVKASPKAVDSAVDRDFQIVDLSLIESALPSLEAAGLA